MNKNIKYLLFCIVVVLFLYGCAQQETASTEAENITENEQPKELQQETPAQEATQQPESKSSDKFIVANPIDLSQIARISKFRSCIGHDYSGLNADGEKETLRSMKHYIEPNSQLLGSENKIKIFAPFDGKVFELEESPPGNRISFSADISSKWKFIFFHVNPLPEIKSGSKVKAGQLIGYVDKLSEHNFDFALKQFNWGKQVFDSPFLHMSSSLLDEYAAKGITLENIITPKTERDNNPCPVSGTSNGDARFEGYSDDYFVKLK